MQTFGCICGNVLFFENTACENCGREVGWCPGCEKISALEQRGPGLYQCVSPGCDTLVQKCANYAREGVCNRCVAVTDGPPDPNRLCDCCRFNVTIPDLSVAGNRLRWARLEAAKRRLFYGLDGIGLPYGTAADGFDPPLAFEFKGDIIAPDGLWRTMGDDERVYTGHADGKITINIREADDVEREKLRVDFGEAHRTLIGHFRHEIGHYYWDVLVRDRYEGSFAEIFGDYRNPPYGEALSRYYENGPPTDWGRTFVSAYAAMHPWEDWAETFALYLAIVSVLDTASNLNLIGFKPADDLGTMLWHYHQLGLVLNELSRDIGLLDLVPVVITSAIREKLDFVHRMVVLGARTQSGFQQEAVSPSA
jgi:hypothetical protein